MLERGEREGTGAAVSLKAGGSSLTAADDFVARCWQSLGDAPCRVESRLVAPRRAAVNKPVLGSDFN